MNAFATFTGTAATKAPGVKPAFSCAHIGSASVVTRMTLPASPQQVWEALMFYELIGKRPPFLLRLLLPLPIRTDGRKSQVGDEVKCHYADGHLLKRVIRVSRGSQYVFEVVEQELKVGDGIRLLGGCYELRQLPGDKTEVALETRYVSTNRPRWLCRRIEAAVCHSFHRYILRAVRNNLPSL